VADIVDFICFDCSCVAVAVHVADVDLGDGGGVCRLLWLSSLSISPSS
jgi:hypothetical protein